MQHSLFHKLTVSELAEKSPTIYVAAMPNTMHGFKSKSQLTVRISLLAVCDRLIQQLVTCQCDRLIQQLVTFCQVSDSQN